MNKLKTWWHRHKDSIRERLPDMAATALVSVIASIAACIVYRLIH